MPDQDVPSSSGKINIIYLFHEENNKWVCGEISNRSRLYFRQRKANSRTVIQKNLNPIPQVTKIQIYCKIAPAILLEDILALSADERVASVEFTEDHLTVGLKDGRTISVPIEWYPRLGHGSQGERTNWQICGGGYGIHWPELDEDLSTEGMLRGAPAPSKRPR